MAEYVRLRLAAAKVGVSMAFLALLAGVADKAHAATPKGRAAASVAGIPGVSSILKLDKVFIKLDNALLKLENKLSTNYFTAQKIDSTFLKIKTAHQKYLSQVDAADKWLKITDANAEFLNKDSTAVDSRKLGGLPVSSFVQGNNTGVVSGALNNLTSSSQQLLSLSGGIIVVSIQQPAGAAPTLTIHNGTAVTLAGAVDMGDGSVSRAVTLKPNGDTALPAVQSPAAEVRLQIFPGGTFTNVVSILIGLTPNPSNNQVTQAVAQAFTGGV
jgi:hypothetical protein